MADLQLHDLISLDRDVAAGWKALTQWRSAVAQDPDAHAEAEPLEPVRHIAGKATWDALGALSPSTADAPLRDALKRWVLALTQARIGLPNEVAWARAATDPRGFFDGEPPRRVSWRDAWHGVSAARGVRETGLWLEAAAAAGPSLAQAVRAKAQRRVEVARRFGIEHPWSGLTSIAPSLLRDLATRLLDRTQDLSRAAWKDASREGAGAAAVIHAAVARDAGEGWPARLTPRWLEDVFGPAPKGMPIEMTPLAAPLGAASFARALVAFGFAVRLAAIPSSLPFAVAHDPAFIGAHRLGFVFGALASDAQWQARVLGIGRHTAGAQSRLLARSALLDARLHAARLLLGDEAAIPPRDRFDELGVRLFERPLDPRLCGAWPGAREDEPARLIALIDSRALAESLRDRFDSDWYRNPRAWEYLREHGAAPAHESIDAAGLAARIDVLAREFECLVG
ncbi:MAG: hypothetical protein M3O46_01355 [Myxococcota bacterium]|nr:hypothetical protein [Myxococcota bacterium]